MKRFLFVCAAAIVMLAGAQSKAEAAIATQLHICQGATCVDFFGANVVAGGGVVLVGDYRIEAVVGAALENPDFAQTATVTLNVSRIDDTFGTPLDVWLQATGFTLPDGPAYVVSTSLSATSSDNPGSVIDFMAWLSTTNATGFPPAGSTATGLIGCAPTGTPGSTGSCAVNGLPTLVNPSGTPYSLTTRTRFHIGVGDEILYDSTGRARVDAVPEPMSLMLIGTGLLGLGARARRRLKK